MLLCEPNVSEGRDEARMARFVDAVAGTPGVRLLHHSSDPDHHRMVLAYLGAPDAVLQATIALATKVFGEVDLRRHAGQHPRIGALDVVPFVCGPESTEDTARDACEAFGRWAGERGVPVLYYERAATSPERASLPRVRAGQFEGLGPKLRDPRWAPDEGPAVPHPSVGAMAVGVRDPLVRFNVNLDTSDPGPAREIASQVRESGGGLPHVRALGIVLASRRMTQVSMNLTRHRATSIETAYAEVERMALGLGVSLAGSELIGPVPASALEGLNLDRIGVEVDPDQVLSWTGAAEPGAGV